MKALIAELSRRRVYKVGAIYLVTAWLLIQVIVTVEAPVGLPGWADTAVIWVLMIGFPIALVLAWASDAKLAGLGGDGTSSTGSGAGDSTNTATDRIAQSDVRFCSTPGGIRLAFAVNGSGYPVVNAGNWLSHQELEWEKHQIFRPILRDFSSAYQLITYDGRGTGLSDRDVTEFSLDTMVEDMEVVVDRLSLPQFAILAFSQSASTAVAYAAKHPDRVSHLLFFGGFIHNFRSADEIEAMATLFEKNWGQENPATRQMFTTVMFPEGTPEEYEAFNEMQRKSISPRNAARLFTACHATDTREFAKQVAAPALVMHARDEQGVPLEYGREIAKLIPNARFVALDSKNHVLLEREAAYPRFIEESFAFIDSKR